MKFDLPTLVFLLGVIYFTQVLAFAVQYRVNRAIPGIGWWLAGSAALAVGHVLLTLGPYPVVRVFGWLGNPVMVAGRISILVGVLRFLDRREHRWTIAGLFVLTLALYYAFAFGHPSLVGRTVVISVASSVFSLATAAALLFKRPGDLPAGSARLTGGVFLAHGAVLAVVGGYTLVAPPVASYTQYAPIQLAAFIVPALTSNLWTFGLVLMVNQRETVERAALEARNRQLRKAESLGRMAGAIAHHFNNQLQSVLLNLEMLQSPSGDPSHRVDRARAAAERAGEVSRLMLAYLGQTSGDRQPQSLGDLCRGCLPILQAAMPDRPLALDLPRPEPMVVANAPELQQVLANLVTNAAEAMAGREGPVRVRLSIQASADFPLARGFPVDWRPTTAECACLEVVDTGHGIAEPDLDLLFDPFFTTRFTGRGLGLPVALGIVQAHGGAIAVASRPGGGSTFRVFLPLHARAAVPAPGAAGDARPARPSGTVLLVDDDPLVLEVAGALVGRMGFKVRTAADGDAALAAFALEPEAFQCVITDLTMPGKDGWDVLAALRRIRPDLPVILASGYARGQVLAASRAEGPQAFLWKPYTRDQLRQALDLVLG